jgi:hypothetical protein
MKTSSEPAAVYEADGETLHLVVRESDSDAIWRTRRLDGIWSDWKRVGSELTDAAPAVTWNQSDGHAWIAVRHAGDGELRVNRVRGSDEEAGWERVGPPGVSGWGSAPAIVYDGERVRVFVSEGKPPYGSYESAWDGSWSDWRRTTADKASFGQPASANVNGDVNLVTRGFLWVLQERALE